MGLQALMQKMAASGPAGGAAADGDGKRKVEMDMSQLG
jgi:hypothetical protein